MAVYILIVRVNIYYYVIYWRQITNNPELYISPSKKIISVYEPNEGYRTNKWSAFIFVIQYLTSS